MERKMQEKDAIIGEKQTKIQELDVKVEGQRALLES